MGSKMNMTKNKNILTIELDTKEEETVNWIYSSFGNFKLKMFLEDYLKQRENNMHAHKDRELLKSIKEQQKNG
jgi:hypothetical protein